MHHGMSSVGSIVMGAFVEIFRVPLCITLTAASFVIIATTLFTACRKENYSAIHACVSMALCISNNERQQIAEFLFSRLLPLEP
jgi:hypothetical protein